MASRKNVGFSLLELVITISIGLILCGITFMALQPILLQSHVNTAYETTLMVLRNTRNLAITQGHQYQVNFAPLAGAVPATLTVSYQPPAVGNGAAPPLQLVQTYTLPKDVNFAVQTGFPGAAPDSFGTGLLPIDFGQTLAGEPLLFVVFMPDGSAQDGNSNLNSGIVYLTRPTGNIYTSKAITVWGATGRIRGWYLDQKGGGPVWIQQ
jgi:type II secretory pathway pseudopilin PulG